VRFVQLYSGGGHIEDTWDGHNNCITNHTLHAGETDRPIAALMTDLKRTGLWEETLLVWGGEFGRTPTSEGVGKPGRDHNPHGFSVWLSGAGVKGGQAIGATDELGFKAVERPCHVSDLHATILHLMGLEHEKLTYFHQGMNQRLTGVRGERGLSSIIVSCLARFMPLLSALLQSRSRLNTFEQKAEYSDDIPATRPVRTHSCRPRFYRGLSE
jgi:Protein of unknown function (DUF1501)